jgi:hypothetical protein
MIVMSGECDCDCCRVNELLNELGALMVKQKCAMLFKQGYTRDEVNVALNEQLIPELNCWVADMMQGFMDDSSAGHTVN